jgi:ABC-type Fe3+ transport system permease subunit
MMKETGSAINVRFPSFLIPSLDAPMGQSGDRMEAAALMMEAARWRLLIDGGVSFLRAR